SNRANGADDFDLYRAARHGDGWSRPVALEGLNTTQSERAPLPTFDDFSLYFARADRSANGARDFDLWRARSIELYRMPPRQIGWIDLVILGALVVLALLVWLAKRWPRMELIYKCYLISILVHAGVLWLARGWYLPGVGRGQLWDTGSPE